MQVQASVAETRKQNIAQKEKKTTIFWVEEDIFAILNRSLFVVQNYWLL